MLLDETMKYIFCFSCNCFTKFIEFDDKEFFVLQETMAFGWKSIYIKNTNSHSYFNQIHEIH